MHLARRVAVNKYPCTWCTRYSFENEASFDFIGGDERVLLNVGGHVFQTKAEVLCRDRYSLLACVCKTESPIPKDEEGTFFFERDW